jgi:hypothetical protein
VKHQFVECFDPVLGGDDMVSLTGQAIIERGPEEFVVIDDKDSSLFHGQPLLL